METDGVLNNAGSLVVHVTGECEKFLGLWRCWSCISRVHLVGFRIDELCMCGLRLLRV
jgi:hypothetical protein